MLHGDRRTPPEHGVLQYTGVGLPIKQTLLLLTALAVLCSHREATAG